MTAILKVACPKKKTEKYMHLRSIEQVGGAVLWCFSRIRPAEGAIPPCLQNLVLDSLKQLKAQSPLNL